MVIARKQMTRVHNLHDKVINIRCQDNHLEQESQLKLLAEADLKMLQHPRWSAL